MHRNVSQHSKVRTVKCGVCNCANFAPNIQRFHNWTRSTVIAMRITKSSNEGGLAQMVERSLSMREVPGSMPGSSITLFTQLTTFTICVNELHQPQHVRMAERSKAPDSSYLSLKWDFWYTYVCESSNPTPVKNFLLGKCATLSIESNFMCEKNWEVDSFSMKFSWYVTKAGWPSGLRRQTQVIFLWNETSGTRMCAWVRIPLLSNFFTRKVSDT